MFPVFPFSTKAVRIIFSILLNVVALSHSAFGQAPSPGMVLSASTAAAHKDYAVAFKANSQLFSGPEYVDYSLRYHVREGHQFFLTTEIQPGVANYNNHNFNNLQLQYDLVLDQVILHQPGSPLMLRFIDENVRSFAVGGHHFTRLVADSTSNNVIRTGYYEVLLDSTVQVLAKRTKRLQEHIVLPNVNVEFTATDNLFIKRAGRYYPVAGKSSVTRLFADHGKEIQHFIQEHGLKFRKASRETDIVALAAYYCSLSTL